MIKDWKEMPETSLVWVYQAKEKLTKEQKNRILTEGKEFVSRWESHGTPIPGTVEVFEDLFVVITADDGGENLCGRAKSAQIQLVQALEKELNISLTDRMVTAYQKGETPNVISFDEFKQLAKNKEINQETIVYNNLVATKKEFEENWKTPAKNSWHARFLN